EDAPDDELRRNGAVPAIFLEPERDVVAVVGQERLEARSLAEGDGAAAVPAGAADPETEVLAVADGCELGDSYACGEERRRGVAQPERSEPRELGAEVEGQRLVAADDRVDACDGLEVGLVEDVFGVAREGCREG